MLIVNGVRVIEFMSIVVKIVSWLLYGIFNVVVLIVEVVNIKIGMKSGKINKFNSILFFCKFMVSVILIVLIKFSVGVFSNRVSIIVS